LQERAAPPRGAGAGSDGRVTLELAALTGWDSSPHLLGLTGLQFIGEDGAVLAAGEHCTFVRRLRFSIPIRADELGVLKRRGARTGTDLSKTDVVDSLLTT
jgi:hypothetical protein